MTQQSLFNHTVEQDQAGLRLDRLCTILWPDLSRARIQSLMKDHHISVNGISITPSYKTRLDDQITLVIPEITEAIPQAQVVAFDIVYEDNLLLVINKPAGLVVHPGAGNHDQTLVNGLLNHCQSSLSGIGGVKRPGIVHRLDKGTSGLMVVAKTDYAHQYLSKQFVDRTLSRRYKTIIWGTILPLDGTIEGDIGRDFHHRQKMKVLTHGGKPAITDYKTIEKIGSRASLIQCNLRTGRTHQIRVHLEYKGHGIIGDSLYGAPPRGLNPQITQTLHTLTNQKQRPCLHAEQITFLHPETHKNMRFTCPWPDDIQQVYNYLQRI